MGGAGAVLRGLTVGDDPSVWERLGFTVEHGEVRLGGVRVHLTGTGGGLRGWTLAPAPSGDLDGLPQVEGVGSPAGGPVAHPNGVTGVDHVVVATDDHDRTVAALAASGLHPRRTVDAVRGDHGTRYGFWLLGTCVLEVIGPVPARPAPGPARFSGLALVADDLDRLGPHAGAAKAAVQPGRRIVTLRTAEVGGTVPLAVLTPRR